MKRQKNWLSIVLSLVMVMTCMFTTVPVFGVPVTTSTELVLRDVSQVSSTISPGETFSIEVSSLLQGLSSEQQDAKKTLEILDVQVSGSVDSSNMTFYTSGSGTVTVGSINKCVINGLKYLGGDKKITVSISVGPNDTEEIWVTSNTLELTLNAKTTEDLEDVLVVDNKSNLVVKTGQTQQVEVKVTNRGDAAITQADMTFALNSKVAGVEVKTSTATLRNIKAKETKTVTFSIQVASTAKEGVYPATVTVAGNSYPINVYVDSSVIPSALEVSHVNGKAYTAGDTNDVTFILKNVGQKEAKNIRFEVVNSENISIVGASNVKRIDSIQGSSSQNITMQVKLSSSYKGDSVPIQIKLEYTNSEGEKEEDTQYIYLNTTATTTTTEATSEVVISNVISPTVTYGVDENFTIKFNLSSTTGAKNLKISVKGAEGIVPKSQNLFFLTDLPKGETKQYSVNFAATSAAVSSSHPIEINVEYESQEKTITISQYGSVNIKNDKVEEDNKDDDKLKGKPRVIIGEYVVNPTIVQAGENFELHLGFLNTSSKHVVNNLKANIKVVEQGENNTGNVFTPVGGSNTFYIDRLATGEMATKSVTLYTIPSAKAKTYEITVDMVYEDGEGNEITATESIGIPVEQVTKIEIGDVYVEYAQVGMEAGLSATFYNRGRTDVTNMMVYIEGEGFSIEENKTFIGNFKQGDTENYEPTLIPQVGGMLQGILVVEYEDTTGKTERIEKEFEFSVEEMYIEEPWVPGGDAWNPDEFNENSEAGTSKVGLLAGIGVGIIAALIITVVVLKRRKSKKDEMMFDEEE